MLGIIKKRGVVGLGACLIVLLLFSVLSILFLISDVSAFGISTPYLEANTLYVNPSNNYVYTITLQNGDDQDYYVDINYSSTNNVANLKKTRYYTPANTYDTKIYFDIIISKDAKVGETYILDYVAKPKGNSTDTIPLGVEIRRSITIVVTDKEVQNNIPVVTNINELAVPVTETTKTDTNIFTKYLQNYAFIPVVIIVVMVLLILIFLRLWRLSKSMSLKLSNERVTNHTISRSISLQEMILLLEKMTNEEFELSEIKELVIAKIYELTTNSMTKDLNNLSRREIISQLRRIH